MSPVMSIAAASLEFTTVTLPADSFEIGAADDFERYLERAEAAKQEVSREARRFDEALSEARKELAEDLKSRRERLDQELKRARRQEDELEEADKAEADDKADEEAQKFKAVRPGRQATMKAVFIAGSYLPFGFKSQLQTSLLATGKPESALNGWLVGGGGSSAGLLKAALESLGSLGSRFKLDKEGLDDLATIFRDSGLDEEKNAELIAGLASGPMNLDRVLLTVSKAESYLAEAKALAELEGTTETAQGGLTATADGLNSLGQFLASLGISTEMVKAVTSAVGPGESLTSAGLAAILTGEGGDELLAPCLADGDLSSLVGALKSMGLDQRGMEGLNVLMGQEGANLGDLLGLLAFLETPEPLSANPAKAAADVQRLLTRTSQEGALVKEPLFNEIILKLANLGDRELSDDFAELSPALQALRGGLGTASQGDPIGGHGGGKSGSGDGRERQERHLAAMGLGGETAASRAAGDGLFQSAMAGQTAGGSMGEAIARQLEQKLVYSLRRGVHRLKMSLSPENLGHLNIELKVKDDKLVAYIKADSEEAYSALEGEMGALKDALAAEGLELAMTLSYEGEDRSRQSLTRTGYGRELENDANEGEEEALDDDQIGQDGILEASRLFDRVV